jgi:hypothetical protein
MTAVKSKRPVAFVEVPTHGIISDAHTGEIVMERGRTRLVRAYSKSVERCVGSGAPTTNFRLSANKHGQILTAIGPIVIASVDMAFPGCASSDEIISADEALNRAGATRGNSPAGRALDWAVRDNKKLAQWRVHRKMMDVFTSALFGGIQIGDKKPVQKPGRINIDVVSSYPFMATQPLPRVRDAIVERGLRPHAVLVKVAGRQYAPALFSRTEKGNTTYAEEVYGWYVREEVEYHVAMGRVHIDRVLKSVTFPHFDKYLCPAVDHLFTHREKYHRSTPERNVIKTALNGLLGKFASPISTWRPARATELEQIGHTRHATTIKLGASALVNDLTLTGIYPRHCNIIWTALTYARARVRLWQKIDEITAAGGRILWAHTDAIIADVPPTYRMVSGEALGDWRVIE